MRLLVLSLSAVLLAGCSKPDAPPADAPAPPAAAPTLNLADLAGTWNMKTMAEGSDSALVTYTMTLTGTTDGWTINFPGRDPMPMTATVSGDSVITSVAPYESMLRKGVQVSTTSVVRLVDGKLVGTTIARYATTGADSVVRLGMEGTRAP
jgi:hypothetical protein